MLCPNCSSELTNEVYDGQAIAHCMQCGASFFAENGINRIYLDTAQRLASERKMEVAFKTKLNCPRDDSALELVHEESVPADCLIYRCPKCSGILSSPHDLIRFKEAQKAKIDFHKMWGRPLGSLSTILIFGLLVVAVVTVTMFTRSFLLNPNALQNTRASDGLQDVFISREGDSITFSFRTERPVQSEITFIDKTTGQQATRVISAEPANFHGLKTKFFKPNTPQTGLPSPTMPFEFILQFNAKDDIYYTVKLTDGKNVTTTPETKLTIQ